MNQLIGCFFFRGDVHAALTKQRIHAIVSQVIDELEHRRATGKADYVKALADEVQRGGIAAWKTLRDLAAAEEREERKR
jgi:hypothetical protein